MSKPRNSQKRDEIYSVVARLFAHKGYHSTSMREIAGELGMNQSSLYHYFKSKEDVLYKLMNDAMDDAMATLEEICAADLSPEDKLKKVLGFYTRYYAGDQERLILLVNEKNSLSDAYRQKLIQKERRYVNLFKMIFEELAGHNKIKEIPPSVATFTFLGMVHYTIKWYNKKGPVGLDELADIFVEIFSKGILK
ncbi:MAG: TetR family transcriptional regulator [Deltaproteobacteria bacterium]|nr:TetR family transcriptional regulator [Deltaproteobacteria bacterium]MBW2119287.1 TetR family transcriptional regulator [Deltaproteobacteria bacterium]MBW2344903.1 TetR family transcriptional regulator [Deltaproteobacteria bacterium]